MHFPSLKVFKIKQIIYLKKKNSPHGTEETDLLLKEITKFYYGSHSHVNIQNSCTRCAPFFQANFINYYGLFSCYVTSDSLRPLGLLHAWLHWPSLSSGVCSNSRPFWSVMLSNHLILHHQIPLLLSIFPSINHGLFQ